MLWAAGMARDDAYFMLTDARTMRPAVEATIAWEWRRLAMLSRRLDKAGERIEGRRCRAAKRQVDEVRRLKADGLGTTEIARRLGISRKSVWRIVRPQEGAGSGGEGGLTTTQRKHHDGT